MYQIKMHGWKCIGVGVKYTFCAFIIPLIYYE